MTTLPVNASLTFQIRHTREYTKSLSYDEFMKYKNNCHTVVSVNIICDKDAVVPYTFNPRIINKFVCLRELFVSNVRFLHPIFTCPHLINELHINMCTNLKSVILNRNVISMTVKGCCDLIAIGPIINKNCTLTILNCPNFQTLPRDYYHDDKNYGVALHLQNVPNARLDTLQNAITTLMIFGKLNNLPKKAPSAITDLHITSELFNSMYELFTNVQCYSFDTGVLSIPAMHKLIYRVINNNEHIAYNTLWTKNSAFAFIVQSITSLYTNTDVAKQNIDYDMVFKILTLICPKYFVPVKSIKFDSTFSLYESIIITALPHFYKCLCACRIANPVKFSIFCNKMRDAMRQQ